MRRSIRGAPGHLGGDWGIFLLIVLVVVIVGALGLAFVPGVGGTRWGHMGGRGGICPWCGGRGVVGGWGILGTLLALVLGLGFIVLLAIGVVALLRQGDDGDASFQGMSSPTARDILAERYARGEITEEEYRRMRKQIDE